MSYGMATWDGNSTQLFSTADRLIRVIHVEHVLQNDPTREILIPGLRADRTFWITQSDVPFRRGPVAAVFDGRVRVWGSQTAGSLAAICSSGVIIFLGYG